jgi:lipopolysaccharide export system protein LptA
VIPKLLLVCACVLTLTVVGTALAASQANKVTGTVQQVDEQTGRIVIDGQTFVMQQSGPLALTPEVGHKVTLFYEERNGRKVITRIGQSQGPAPDR